MTWEAPDFVEVKMDAEINSYQDDFGGDQDDRFYAHRRRTHDSPSATPEGLSCF